MYFSSPARTRLAFGPGRAVLILGPTAKVLVLVLMESSKYGSVHTELSAAGWTTPLAAQSWEDVTVNLRRRGWDGGSTAARRGSGVGPLGNAANIPAGASCCFGVRA